MMEHFNTKLLIFYDLKVTDPAIANINPIIFSFFENFNDIFYI